MAQQNKIVIDTNMLIGVKKFKVDVFEEVKKMLGNVEFVISEKISEELNFLEQKGHNLSFEKELLDKQNVQTEKTNADNADDSVLELSKKGYIVATNDKELIQKVKKHGGKIISMRKKSFLEMR